MTKPVQLLLPLDIPGDKIQLPTEDEKELVATAASLLLQVFLCEEDEEVEDDL